MYTTVYDFFLGSLAAGGFHGWFKQIIGEEDYSTYLIKAGPGCGKSTFMKRLAGAGQENDSAPVERLHCSGDPDSLDGVVLHGQGALVLDATAPHTVDCVYPDAAESVVSFYDTLDRAYLRKNREGVLKNGKTNTELLRQAAGHYTVGCSLLARRRSIVAAYLDKSALQVFTARLAQRTMPVQRGAKAGKQFHRLLSAPTLNGLTIFYDTISALAPERLYAIHDEYGAASAQMLAQLATHAAKNGYDAYLCHCPTAQHAKLDHLFIPALGLGFVTANKAHPMLFANQKNIHTKQFINMPALRSRKSLLDWQLRLANELFDRTYALESEAKAAHDEMEKYYIAATDFCAVDAMRAELTQALFGKAE